MTILDNFKRNGARFGFPLLACVLWARGAAAEVTLVEKDGWTFVADGRIGAFVSYGSGEDFPDPTEPPPAPDPTMQSQHPTHNIMGFGKLPGVAAGFGWQSNFQEDSEGKFSAMRVRSGTTTNVLGFGLKRAINDSTTVSGYIKIWAPIESLGRDKWKIVDADVREGYLTLDGSWGSVEAGRNYGLFGRSTYEVDALYGHGYGVGLPCTDDIGPTCGQVGAGAIHPGFAAGVIYTTPSMGGLKLAVGLYDPVRVPSLYERVPLLRPEGAVTFETPLGDTGLIKVGVEGLYQPLSRINDEDADNDPATPLEAVETKEKFWGVSGGARIEVGPARIGGGVFHGRGLGLTYALQSTDATTGPGVTADPATGLLLLDSAHPKLRTFTGFHGQLAFVFGAAQVGVGGGVASVGKLDSDDINVGLSPGKQHVGMSVMATYNLSDSVVLGFDYMRFTATWRGAPEAAIDPATGAVMTDATSGIQLLTGNRLEAEEQTLNFINAGVTYHW